MRLLFDGEQEEDYIGPPLPFKGEKKGLYVLVNMVMVMVCLKSYVI